MVIYHIVRMFSQVAPLQPCDDGRTGGSGTCPSVDKLGKSIT